MQCNGNFKQWFNIFLIISKAWQGYESKAYGLSNHNLNLQSKKLSRTRDIPNFLTQGWADTTFYMSNWSETYAFSHILDALFLYFLTSISTPKVDKNRTLDCTSINLTHSYILDLFFNLHEKIMLWLNDLRRYAKWSETRKFHDMSGEKFINCVIGNTLFQSNVSVNLFKVQLYI